jgi:hypothetical protein
MIKKLQGIAEEFAYDIDDYYSGDYGGPCINKIPVASWVEDNFDYNKQVWVALADETFTGELEVWSGMRGWSEWTPAEPSEFLVGPHDLNQIINQYEGKDITLIVSDEGPINPTEL